MVRSQVYPNFWSWSVKPKTTLFQALFSKNQTANFQPKMYTLNQWLRSIFSVPTIHYVAYEHKLHEHTVLSTRDVMVLISFSRAEAQK